MEQKKEIPPPIFEALSEDHKTFLDDLPDEVVRYLFRLNPVLIVGSKLTFNVTDDGVPKQTIEFTAAQVLEAVDYLEYLMLRGYRPIVFKEEEPNE